MKKQEIISKEVTVKLVEDFLKDYNVNSFMLVCGNSLKKLPFAKELFNMPSLAVRFSDFDPNPDYESIVKGVDIYKQKGCDSIVAIGGGSPLDVAKGIKMFSGMDREKDYTTQPLKDTGIPLMTIPTTAGTGSESTQYAVYYKEGIKQSLAHESILPDRVILDASTLKTLPLYQKKCTMLDALCQAIESWWSISSTDESIALSKRSIETIMAHAYDYIAGEESALVPIMEASNLAGKAIAITATTAPHAMSYKLTTIFDLPHGHSVAIVLPRVFGYMIDHVDTTHDERGSEHLRLTFNDIGKALGGEDSLSGLENLKKMLDDFEILWPQIEENQLTDMVKAVDINRLKNNPVYLDEKVIYNIYSGRV